MKKINSKITTWGNSFGLRLSKDFVVSLNISPNAPLEIIQTSQNSFEVKEDRDERIISKEEFWKAMKEGKFKKSEEIDWGPPQGKEIW